MYTLTHTHTVYIGPVHSNSHTIPTRSQFDLVVVGGGIVGTAAAREIVHRHPHLKVALLEKEPHLAAHQSGHNSGVVHAGIYYTPGTLKARLCVEGMRLAYDYFDAKRIPYRKCGKLIVATDALEVQRLHALHERGLANGVADLQLIAADRIADIEPYCRGELALWSPHTGIVDWALVTRHYAHDFVGAGGTVYVDFEAARFADSGSAAYPVRISGRGPLDVVDTRYVLTCGGLHADRVAELTGCARAPRIVPFRGEYLLLDPAKAHMVRGNIYPVPDPRFPFLGVHFTPRMDGSVWLGPNAVLAFGREGYRWSDVNVPELWDALRYVGFRRLARRYLRYGLGEMAKSAWLPLQVSQLQRYVPAIGEFDVRRGPAGVRAQALAEDGTLVDDFVFHRGDGGGGAGSIAQRVLHCRNAPSPGATSSLAIARMIGDRLDGEFGLRAERNG